MSSDASLHTAHGEDLTLSMHGNYVDLMTLRTDGSWAVAHLSEEEAVRVGLALIAWAHGHQVTTLEFD